MKAKFFSLTLPVWGEKGDIKVVRLTKDGKEIENMGYKNKIKL